MSLVDAYYWSQIILTLIALGAAIAAYRQIQTMKRLEIMKILEAPHVKEARRIVYSGTRNKNGKKWWKYGDPDFNEDLEKAASITLSSFDLAGIVARGSNRRFLCRHWVHTICWTHDALRDLLEDRRMEMGGDTRPFPGFISLYRSARRHDHRRHAGPN